MSTGRRVIPTHSRFTARTPLRAGLLLAGGLLLTACATEPPPLGQTISDMAPVTVPVEPMPVPRVALDQVEDSYRAALEVAEDPETRHRIKTRLADMEMARSERRQVDQAEQKAYFADAITLYEDLLAASEAQPATEEGAAERARLLYQLSKAYALDGRMEESNRALDELVRQYPDSEFAAEADFRRAELAFSEGDYERAEELYDQVLGAGQTPFYSNAVYMHGWSLFKQGKYRESLTSFTYALDDLTVPGVDVEQLSNSRQNLLADTLRIMAIAFSYLDGADTIAELYEKQGQLHYQHLLYQQLGDLYLDKKRYRDSADTYLKFTELFPDSDYAPQLAVSAIEAYGKGNFPSLVRPAKEAFVRNYGVDSRYLAMRSMLEQEPILPHLHQFLDELASYYHNRAQTAQQGEERASAQTRQDFLQAADYYRQFVSLFPMDEAVPRMTFLMAEAYYEGEAFVEALLAYEQAAYHYMAPGNGADAGYAAVLVLEQLIQATPDNQPDVLQKWQAHKVRSATSFADTYSSDKRAPQVLASAAEELFEQGDLKQAVALATRLTGWQPMPTAAIQKTAWLVRAHSLFDLGLFSTAEDAYRQTLQRLEPKDKDRPQVIERIAASMYRQAEAQLANGDKRGAVERLLQIREIAPASDIAMTSQYDAANYLMDLQEWDRAEQVLVDFRQRYPEHQLAGTIGPKLATLYQTTENWEAAARELSAMAENDQDPEARRQSLYLAAELYEKAGNPAQAIVHYRSYAHGYPEPFGLATEARFQLVELYQKTGEPLKRNYWLKKLIDAHEEARENGGSTDRALYLAAFASRELADIEYHAFRNIKLTLPLKRNLQRKKAAMEKTLESYGRVLDYGVEEFATEANNRIGMVYAELSRDLMDSERPEGLSALEMEQYEILLEEQAFPFEEKAIAIHAANAERSWNGTYDEWVKRSFDVLAKLLPARYGKEEERQEVSRAIY